MINERVNVLCHLWHFGENMPQEHSLSLRQTGQYITVMNGGLEASLQPSQTKKTYGTLDKATLSERVAS